MLTIKEPMDRRSPQREQPATIQGMRASPASARTRSWKTRCSAALALLLLLGSACRDAAAPYAPERAGSAAAPRAPHREASPDLAAALDGAATVDRAATVKDTADLGTARVIDAGGGAAERCPGQYEVLYCQGTGYDQCGVEARRAKQEGRTARRCTPEKRCITRCQARPPKSTPGGNWCSRVSERLYRCDALIPAEAPHGGAGAGVL